jgi:hypothetical protein
MNAGELYDRDFFEWTVQNAELQVKQLDRRNSPAGSRYGSFVEEACL